MKQKTTAKEAAYKFLKKLEQRLNGAVPPTTELTSMVDAIWKKPPDLKTEREKIESKENVPFFYLQFQKFLN